MSESVDLFEQLLQDGEPYQEENRDLLATLHQLSKGNLQNELDVRIRGLLAEGNK